MATFSAFRWKLPTELELLLVLELDKQHANPIPAKFLSLRRAATNDCQTSFEGLRTAKDEWFRFSLTWSRAGYSELELPCQGVVVLSDSREAELKSTAERCLQLQ